MNVAEKLPSNQFVHIPIKADIEFHSVCRLNTLNLRNLSLISPMRTINSIISFTLPICPALRREIGDVYEIEQKINQSKYFLSIQFFFFFPLSRIEYCPCHHISRRPRVHFNRNEANQSIRLSGDCARARTNTQVNYW